MKMYMHYWKQALLSFMNLTLETRKCDNTAKMLEQVKNRQSFHQDIKEGSENVVKTHIKIIHD